jgi:hypothetical protein
MTVNFRKAPRKCCGVIGSGTPRNPTKPNINSPETGLQATSGTIEMAETYQLKGDFGFIGMSSFLLRSDSRAGDDGSSDGHEFEEKDPTGKYTLGQ